MTRYTLTPAYCYRRRSQPMRCWTLENSRGTVICMIWGQEQCNKLKQAMQTIEWPEDWWPEPIANRKMKQNLMAAGAHISRYSL